MLSDANLYAAWADVVVQPASGGSSGSSTVNCSLILGWTFTQFTRNLPDGSVPYQFNLSISGGMTSDSAVTVDCVMPSPVVADGAAVLESHLTVLQVGAVN